MDEADDLICYIHDGWRPRIEPAAPQRHWMDETPERFAYRCLPLAMANSHGWIVRSPCAFASRWLGGNATDAVEIRLDDGTRQHEAAVSIFGQGILTFHVEGIIRTQPGINLFVSGPPNDPIDGLIPLSGLIETDWSPYSFTMNWRFTRPHQWVRFEEGQPFAFFFPIVRGLVEASNPRFELISAAPELKADFDAWDRSRQAFQERVAADPPSKPSDKWQKLYYRGLSPNGKDPFTAHQTKIKPKPFAGQAVAWASPYEDRLRPLPLPTSISDVASELRRRDWLLQAQELNRQLAADGGGLMRISPPSREEFRDELYAGGRPAIITELAADWRATREWTPETLMGRAGDVAVEVQSGRLRNPTYERDKVSRRDVRAFATFIADCATAGNDTYLTAFNADANTALTDRLAADLGQLDTYLAHEGDYPNGMVWIGGAGTFTPLHHDLTNNLLVQLVGTKTVRLVPPSESRKLYAAGVFSDVEDLDDPARIAAFPAAASVRGFSFDLEPGDALFIPVGWWHQVRSKTFSVSNTYTCFHWPNDAYVTWPG